MVTLEEDVEPGERGTLAGTKEIERPIAAGGTVPVRDMLPVNPILPNVTVDVAEPPATMFAGETGPADMEKSGSMRTVMFVVCVRDPLLPEIVI